MAGALALGLVGAGTQVEAMSFSAGGSASAPANELLLRVAVQPYSLTYSVRNIQILLNELGYNAGTPDGAAGAKTKAAIAAFQADKGFPINGTPSKVVFIQLQKAVAEMQGGAGYSQPQASSSGQASASSSAEVVMDVQAQLRQRGYVIPSITGELDSATKAAIRTYEADNGMPMTGKISQQLLASLAAGSGADDGSGYDEGSGYDDASGYDDGSSGAGAGEDEVYQIEQYLQAFGYDTGEVDGVADQKTQSAIMSFQNDMDLPVDGQPSAELLAELQTAYEEALAEQQGGTTGDDMGTDMGGTDMGDDMGGYGADPATIQEIETALKQKGYKVGPVDGVLDAQLQKAIDDFIRHAQLQLSNEPSPELLSAIQNSNMTAKKGMQQDLIKTGVDALTNILNQ
jgi:peptidoglycan hydrolase-like protein with peptidoglycan-binding domain